MPKNLTEISIRSAHPPVAGTMTLWDGSLKNFGCRVSPRGTKSFIILLGSGKRRTIGRYPVISLAEARTEAKRLLAEKTLGRTFEKSLPFDEARAEFLAHCEKRLRPLTLRDYARLIKRHFPFGRTRLADITPRDVLRYYDKMGATPAEQSHALMALKAFMSWCVKRHYISRSPCEGMSPAKSRVRDRVLSDVELKAVFTAACAGDDAFSWIVAILILTGQRRGEIGALKWDYINERDKTISLPPELTKNKRPHTFPYGLLMAGILDKIPHTSEYVFPASRDHVRGKPTTTFNGWGKCKDEIHRISKTSDWSLHDLRRTFATNMAALGVRIEVTEKLINHVSGTFGGIVAVYQRHTYMDEMRTAITAWESRLSGFLQPAQATLDAAE